MKIHYYNFNIKNSSEALFDLVDGVNRLDRNEREFQSSGSFLTVERVAKENTFLRTDFTLRRMTGGPGRSKRGSLTTDFDLGEDEA